MRELDAINQHLNIYIDAQTGYVPISDAMVKKYSDYLHDQVFPGPNPANIRELAMDGHEKVMMRCAAARLRAGRPRKDGVQIKFNNGWFMIVSAKDSRVVGLVPQVEPENNRTKLSLLSRIMPLYPKVDCLIHDRNCSFMGMAKQVPSLRQIAYYSTDEWHGCKHAKGCPCAPKDHLRLRRRLKGVNTSVSEQTFAWFRNYARVLNTASPNHHHFLVLLFCRLHNDMVVAGEARHLNPHAAQMRRRAGGSYPCTRKRPASQL